MADSGLTEGEYGLISVDGETLQSKVKQNVWAIGDCASLETSKSMSAVIE